MLITLMLITFNIDFELAAKETHCGIRNVENALKAFWQWIKMVQEFFEKYIENKWLCYQIELIKLEQTVIFVDESF